MRIRIVIIEIMRIATADGIAEARGQTNQPPASCTAISGPSTACCTHTPASPRTTTFKGSPGDVRCNAFFPNKLVLQPGDFGGPSMDSSTWHFQALPMLCPRVSHALPHSAPPCPDTSARVAVPGICDSRTFRGRRQALRMPPLHPQPQAWKQDPRTTLLLQALYLREPVA